MTRRVTNAALLLYPRAVRRHHGAELESLVEELIEREGRSRPAVVARLAYDGLIQRLQSRSTAWAAALTLAVTSIGGLAVSDFSAASAHQREVPRAHSAPASAVHTPAPASLDPEARRAVRRSAGIIAP